MTECHVCADAEATTERAGEPVCGDCAPMFDAGVDTPMDPADAREVFAERLRDAELDDQRFIDVVDGEKKAYDHTLLSPDSDELSGNYGVYAGPGEHGGDRVLVDVDVDDYDAENDLPDALTGLPETLAVESPHTDSDGPGGHYYFSAPADALGAVEAETGSRNASLDWGELRVHNYYCVGPGSQLDGCDKDWCNECAEPDGGYYRVAEDRPIVELDAEEVVALATSDGEDGEAERDARTGDDVATSGVSSLDVETYQDRLEKALLDSDDEKLQALWSGDYAAAGYGDDRSEAESSLANRLGWWLDRDEEAVRDAMNGARLPDSVPEPMLRKWPQKGSGYRESVLEAVDNGDSSFGQDDWGTVRFHYENGNRKRARFTAADLLEESDHWLTPRDTEELYRYDEDTGTWTPDGEQYVHRLLNERLGEHNTNAEEDHIVSFIDDNYVQDKDALGADLDEPLVALKNGTLNLETGELLDHSPDHMLLEQVPIRYDPDADCPEFHGFLETALEGDEERIETVYEVIACALAPGLPVDNFVIFHGSGNTGKTTLLETMRELIGDAVSAERLGDLTEEHSAAQLYGARANIVGDLPSGTIHRAGKLKDLTAGGTVNAREKYGKKFQFTNQAEIIAAANNPPEFADDSDAIDRRLVPIEMDVDMVEATEEDISRREAIARYTTEEEKAGILNRAVEAYRRVLAQNALTYQANHTRQQIRDEYERQSNPARRFVEACCAPQVGSDVPKSRVYDAYVSWADSVGAKALRRGQLTSRLKDLDNYSIGESRPTLGGNRVRCYRGIELNEDGERHADHGGETAGDQEKLA